MNPRLTVCGQVFDIRLEVQAPINGTEAYNNGTVNPIFKLEIGGYGAELQEISAFYGVAQPTVESYAFHYYEDLAAEDAKLPTFVNVLAQTYRHITLYNPGQYTVKLSYNSGMVTYATWHVLPLAESQTAKNASPPIARSPVGLSADDPRRLFSSSPTVPL